MKKLARSLPITFLLLCSLLATTYAQVESRPATPWQTSNEIRFWHLTTDDGLSHTRVFAVTQDHAGFLWIGTTDGLNRYDGYDFQVYKPDYEDPNSLDRSIVASLFETETVNLPI